MGTKPGPRVDLSIYDIGATTFYASQADQRFSYCLYVPEAYKQDGDKTYALAVAMHDTERTAGAYRDRFADFAEANDCIVLAPLFPCGIVEPGEQNNYKLLEFHGIRFDLVLLAMIDEIKARYRVHADRFLLYGFSGGGHFAHRFFLVHPERLLGVSIGAPGVVTLLDETRDWWVGVRDLRERFGKPVNLEAMRKVAVHMVIGADDRETWEITIDPGDRWWMEDANIAGADRQDRMRSLKESFERRGIAVRQDVVPGAGHEAAPMVPPVKAFFADVLKRHRAG